MCLWLGYDFQRDMQKALTRIQFREMGQDQVVRATLIR